MSDSLAAARPSQELSEHLERFVCPLMQWLDGKIDKRLVRTFLLTLVAIVTLRHSKYGLLLSELGAYIISPAKAPAGTKRLSNLLRSPKWSYSLIEGFLWHRSNDEVVRLNQAGRTALVLWDESVVEKSESIALEGLGPVRSAQAARLKRIKPGYFNPPGGRPIFVPGMQWISLMVTGMESVPVLVAMRWWTSRGKLASDRRREEAKLLTQCARAWGRRVVHVFDRGFASAAWLGGIFDQDVRFILRWPQRNHLVDAQGARNAWKIPRGKRSQDHRLIWDASRGCWRKTGIVVAAVKHPQYDYPLYLVLSRPGKGRRPWYLLTNEAVDCLEDAWRIVFAYARRWQIEMGFRYSKTELAMESPRLWKGENRMKLLMMTALVYAFLLSLLDERLRPLIEPVMRDWCHRTGKRYRNFAIPLYRLRSALSRLWLAFPTSPQFIFQNQG